MIGLVVQLVFWTAAWVVSIVLYIVGAMAGVRWSILGWLLVMCAVAVWQVVGIGKRIDDAERKRKSTERR